MTGGEPEVRSWVDAARVRLPGGDSRPAQPQGGVLGGFPDPEGGTPCGNAGAGDPAVPIEPSIEDAEYPILSRSPSISWGGANEPRI